MRYSLEPRKRKHVEGHGFLSFVKKKCGDRSGKKTMNNATRKGIGTVKTTSKKVVQKTAEATRDLVGNKRAYKITSAGLAKK